MFPDEDDNLSQFANALADGQNPEDLEAFVDDVRIDWRHILGTIPDFNFA